MSKKNETKAKYIKYVADKAKVLEDCTTQKDKNRKRLSAERK